MKKWIIIILAITLTVLIAIAIYMMILGDIIGKVACTPEGETLPNHETNTPQFCCKGLVEITGGNEDEYYDSELELLTPMGAESICSNCGNSACEEWEHKYNCPIDCEL